MGSALVCLALFGHPAAAIVGEAETANWAIVRPALILFGPRGVCSAAMVGRELALTAAHCVTAVSAVSAMPGSAYCNALKQFDWATVSASCGLAPAFKVAGPDSAWIHVWEIVSHPDYDRDKRQGPDLAMVRLMRPLPATLTPPLIGTRPIRPGDRLTIVGYGLNDSGKQDGIARMATLTVDRRFRLVDDPALGDSGKRGACGGDSGAPVFIHVGAPLLVAIVTGSSGAGCGFNTTFEPIGPHHEWIFDTARRMGATLGP